MYVLNDILPMAEVYRHRLMMRRRYATRARVDYAKDSMPFYGDAGRRLA